MTIPYCYNSEAKKKYAYITDVQATCLRAKNLFTGLDLNPAAYHQLNLFDNFLLPQPIPQPEHVFTAAIQVSKRCLHLH